MREQVEFLENHASQSHCGDRFLFQGFAGGGTLCPAMLMDAYRGLFQEVQAAQQRAFP